VILYARPHLKGWLGKHIATGRVHIISGRSSGGMWRLCERLVGGGAGDVTGLGRHQLCYGRWWAARDEKTIIRSTRPIKPNILGRNSQEKIYRHSSMLIQGMLWRMPHGSHKVSWLAIVARMVYVVPPFPRLDWRAEMPKRMHRRHQRWLEWLGKASGREAP
jgi:hypothetical protein